MRSMVGKTVVYTMHNRFVVLWIVREGKSYRKYVQGKRVSKKCKIPWEVRRQYVKDGTNRVRAMSMLKDMLKLESITEAIRLFERKAGPLQMYSGK